MDFRPGLSWEFLPEVDITAKTVRALRNHIKYVLESSNFYKSYLDGIVPNDIQSLEDFSVLPLTERFHIASNPSDFLAVDSSQVVETVLTSGTSGKSVPFFLTASDLERSSFSYALSLHSIGITDSERVLLLSPMDNAALLGTSLYKGALMTQANVLRAGLGHFTADVALGFLRFFKPTVIIGDISVLKAVTQKCIEKGYDTAASSVKKIVGTSETFLTKELQLNSTASALEKKWNAQLFSLYSATELMVSYCSTACKNGAHAHPELIYTEIVDELGNMVPDGELGELVATPLGVEGLPLVRYRTGDISFRVPGSCSCGRNSMRIGPILGRLEQRSTHSDKQHVQMTPSASEQKSRNIIQEPIFSVPGGNSIDSIQTVARLQSETEKKVQQVRLDERTLIKQSPAIRKSNISEQAESVSLNPRQLSSTSHVVSRSITQEEHTISEPISSIQNENEVSESLSLSAERDIVEEETTEFRQEQEIYCNGTTIFPSSLDSTLESFEEIKDHLTVIDQDGTGKDTLVIHIAAPPAILSNATYAVKSLVGEYIPLLISNIPTIKAMRRDAEVTGTVIDNRKGACSTAHSYSSR